MNIMTGKNVENHIHSTEFKMSQSQIATGEKAESALHFHTLLQSNIQSMDMQQGNQAQMNSNMQSEEAFIEFMQMLQLIMPEMKADENETTLNANQSIQELAAHFIQLLNNIKKDENKDLYKISDFSAVDFEHENIVQESADSLELFVQMLSHIVQELQASLNSVHLTFDQYANNSNFDQTKSFFPLERLLSILKEYQADFPKINQQLIAKLEQVMSETKRPLMLQSHEPQITQDQSVLTQPDLRHTAKQSELNQISNSSGNQETANGYQNMIQADHSKIEFSRSINVNAMREDSNQSLTPMKVSDFADEMSKFIFKRMDVIQKNGLSEAKIQLFPEHLGQLEVKITVHNGQLTALLVSDKLIGKEMLELQLPLLRQSLQSQGFQVDKLEVTYQSNMHPGHSQSGHHQGSRQPFAPPNQRAKTDYASAYLDEIDNLVQHVGDNPITNAVNGTGRGFDASA